MKTFNVQFASDENFNNPPATYMRRVNGVGVTSAVLNWSIKLDAGVWLDDIRFNGSNLGNAHEGSADVTSLLVANANNTVTLNYSRWLDWLGKAGVATITLTVTADEVGVEAPKTVWSLGSLPWWVWLIVACLILSAVAWFLMRTSAGGKAVSAMYGTGRDIYHAVGGA